MNAVQLSIRQRGSSKCSALSVELAEDETVESLTKRIEQKTGLNSRNMRIVFCGKRLTADSKVSDLKLGMQTGLTVTITDELNEPNDAGFDDWVVVNKSRSIANKTFSSFYVFCKFCDQLRPGKLRAYCCSCRGTAVSFLNEPSSWQDVMGINKIFVNCEVCTEEQTPARFSFKCADCSSECALLSCVRSNKHERECVICGEVEPLIFFMDSCAHPSCIPCTRAYLDQILDQWLFVYRTEVGFTMRCVMLDCDQVIKDPHHYYLLGAEKYEKFQKMAAEKFLSIQEGSRFCPDPKCNAGFTVEHDEDETNAEVICPECRGVFCTRCNSLSKCRCQEFNQSAEVIKLTSKPCPQCKAATQKSSGCAHLQCPNCSFNWCWICNQEWSVDCQMDHWFD